MPFEDCMGLLIFLLIIIAIVFGVIVIRNNIVWHHNDVKQKFLEHDEFEAHLQELMTYLLQQSEEQQIEQTLHDSVKRQMEKNQRVMLKEV